MCIYMCTYTVVNIVEFGKLFSTYLVPLQPMNVNVERVDATTMIVSWDKLTLVELKGLADYVVTYSLGGGSRKRQAEGMVMVPWTNNSVTIRGLQSGAAYSVAVGTRTSAGASGKSRCIVV